MAFEPGKCADASYTTIPCNGNLAFVSHDKRGCVIVCAAHSNWRRDLSYVTGHSPDCPYRYATGEFKRTTLV
jgi:hypothetical protein